MDRASFPFSLSGRQANKQTNNNAILGIIMSLKLDQALRKQSIEEWNPICKVARRLKSSSHIHQYLVRMIPRQDCPLGVVQYLLQQHAPQKSTITGYQPPPPSYLADLVAHIWTRLLTGSKDHQEFVLFRAWDYTADDVRFPLLEEWRDLFSQQQSQKPLRQEGSSLIQVPNLDQVVEALEKTATLIRQEPRPMQALPWKLEENKKVTRTLQSQFQVSTDPTMPLLHFLVYNQVPPVIVAVAALVYPQQLEQRDAWGNLPLHYANLSAHEWTQWQKATPYIDFYKQKKKMEDSEKAILHALGTDDDDTDTDSTFTSSSSSFSTSRRGRRTRRRPSRDEEEEDSKPAAKDKPVQQQQSETAVAAAANSTKDDSNDRGTAEPNKPADAKEATIQKLADLFGHATCVPLLTTLYPNAVRYHCPQGRLPLHSYLLSLLDFQRDHIWNEEGLATFSCYSKNNREDWKFIHQDVELLLQLYPESIRYVDPQLHCVAAIVPALARWSRTEPFQDKDVPIKDTPNVTANNNNHAAVPVVAAAAAPVPAPPPQDHGDGILVRDDPVDLDDEEKELRRILNDEQHKSKNTAVDGIFDLCVTSLTYTLLKARPQVLHLATRNVPDNAMWSLYEEQLHRRWKHRQCQAAKLEQEIEELQAQCKEMEEKNRQLKTEKAKVKIAAEEAVAIHEQQHGEATANVGSVPAEVSKVSKRTRSSRSPKKRQLEAASAEETGQLEEDTLQLPDTNNATTPESSKTMPLKKRTLALKKSATPTSSTKKAAGKASSLRNKKRGTTKSSTMEQEPAAPASPAAQDLTAAPTTRARTSQRSLPAKKRRRVVL